MSNGGGLKKRLCNPPAEEVARTGDPELLGLFIGAGRGVEVLDDEKLKSWYVAAVTEVETKYLVERKRLASECVTQMRKLEYELLEAASAAHQADKKIEQ